RRDLAAFHATRVGQIMADQGYHAAEVEQVGKMLRKEGIKRDAEVQALEDVICFTFLRWYFQPFASARTPESLLKVVQKTAKKMSAEGRARVLREFDLPEDLAESFRD
ncbi:MAG: DUF4202 family protein, partial [Albidovulum sp.]